MAAAADFARINPEAIETSGTTPTLLASVPLVVQTAIDALIRVAAVDTSGSTQKVWHVLAAARRDAGGSSLIADPVPLVDPIEDLDAADWDIAISVNTDDHALELHAIGGALTDLTWVADIDVRSHHLD